MRKNQLIHNNVTSHRRRQTDEAENWPCQYAPCQCRWMSSGTCCQEKKGKGGFIGMVPVENTPMLKSAKQLLKNSLISVYQVFHISLPEFHSLFIVCFGLVWLCLLILLWEFFFWKKRNTNWQWRFYLKCIGWPLDHHCLCNCFVALTPYQLSWWYLFIPSMNVDLPRPYMDKIYGRVLPLHLFSTWMWLWLSLSYTTSNRYSSHDSHGIELKEERGRNWYINSRGRSCLHQKAVVFIK